MSHFEEENTSSKEDVSTIHRYPGDLFFRKGTGCKPELYGIIHSSSSGTPAKVTALLQPLQHP